MTPLIQMRFLVLLIRLMKQKVEEVRQFRKILNQRNPGDSGKNSEVIPCNGMIHNSCVPILTLSIMVNVSVSVVSTKFSVFCI